MDTKKLFSDAQLKIIDKMKSLGGLKYVEKLLEELSTQTVFVLGEPILDIYRFCIPEGLSSKSPSVSARFHHEEKYYGGSWAIANHIAGFVKNVELVYPQAMKVTEKIRYVTLDKNQKIFEVTFMEKDDWVNPDPLDLSGANKADICILADFGHRLFEGEILHELKKVKSFVGLNVQTNSSNLGFNLFWKHHRYDLLSIDTREARLALSDRTSDPLTLAQRIKNELPGRHLALTIGPGGAWLFTRGQESHCPAFAETVLDATGAGDAFFALCTCLTKLGADPASTLFLSNVFAGLKTKIIGNKHAVKREELLKAVIDILS